MKVKRPTKADTDKYAHSLRVADTKRIFGYVYAKPVGNKFFYWVERAKTNIKLLGKEFAHPLLYRNFLAQLGYSLSLEYTGPVGLIPLYGDEYCPYWHAGDEIVKRIRVFKNKKSLGIICLRRNEHSHSFDRDVPCEMTYCILGPGGASYETWVLFDVDYIKFLHDELKFTFRLEPWQGIDTDGWQELHVREDEEIPPKWKNTLYVRDKIYENCRFQKVAD